MDPINNLTEYFKKFPGIGERQAKRFVYYLLHQNQNFLNELTNSINYIKKEIAQCPSCYVFFQHKGSKTCDICSNPKSDRSILLITEKDADYENIRRNNFYNGMYFILGGLVPIVEKNTKNNIRLNELMKTIEERSKNDNLKEVILALALSPQGENTDLYLRQILSPLQTKYNFKISSLGRGLSTGLELEYSDSDTLKNALKNRS